MPRLRVKIDATPLLVGYQSGVGKFCRGLLSALVKDPSIEASAFAITWRKLEQLGALVPDGMAVRGRPIPARPVRAAWLHVDWPPVEWFLGRSDVVHGTNFMVPPTSRAARVVTVHDLTPVKYPELCDPASLVFRDFVHRAVRHGAWVHTHSRFVAGEVIDVFDADPSKVRVIPSGIPELHPESAVAGGSRSCPVVLPEGTRRYILAIGTIEPRKNFPGLVAAFDLIAATHPDTALVVIGSDGWGSEALAHAVSSSAHTNRIIRLGYVGDPDVARWLGAAALLAYPSRYEGFGYPPLLAMSLGVPVVATAAGAIPEVVGEAACLVPVGDVDALAAALGAILDDHSLAARLSEAGRERARHYTWQRCASGMVELYEAAAQGVSR